MGRICPILNHPLVDGVLVEDDALVKFIQKRNLDFLASEFVCKTCKQEIIKLYNKILKKAKALHHSRFHHSSVSSLKTSNAASSSSERSVSHYESLQSGQVQKTLNYKNNTVHTSAQQLNVGIDNSSVQNNHSDNSSLAKTASVNQTHMQVLTSITNTYSILQENQINKATNIKATPVEFGNFRNVTIRKKTIKDYLTAGPSTQNGVASAIPGVNISTQNNSQIIISANQRKPQQIASETEDGGDVDRRLSQQPTTSKAVNIYKRPISAIVYSDDDDDEPLSINAYNGTRLPHIQPIPPKRKQNPIESPKSFTRDIMDEYIKDITGG